MKGSRGDLALRVVTVVGWLALLFSVIPGGPIDFELGRIGIAVGPTGSIILALRKLNLPADMVFEAGRQVGKAEAGSVSERPHLRIVERD